MFGRKRITPEAQRYRTLNPKLQIHQRDESRVQARKTRPFWPCGIPAFAEWTSKIEFRCKTQYADVVDIWRQEEVLRESFSRPCWRWSHGLAIEYTLFTCPGKCRYPRHTSGGLSHARSRGGRSSNSVHPPARVRPACAAPRALGLRRIPNFLSHVIDQCHTACLRPSH